MKKLNQFLNKLPVLVAFSAIGWAIWSQGAPNRERAQNHPMVAFFLYGARNADGGVGGA